MNRNPYKFNTWMIQNWSTATGRSIPLETREAGRSVSASFTRTCQNENCPCAASCRSTVNWNLDHCSQTLNLAIITSVVTHSLLHLSVFGLVRLGVWRRTRRFLCGWGCFCRCCCYCYCSCFLFRHRKKIKKINILATIACNTWSRVCHFCVRTAKWWQGDHTACQKKEKKKKQHP